MRQVRQALTPVLVRVWQGQIAPENALKTINRVLNGAIPNGEMLDLLRQVAAKTIHINQFFREIGLE